MIYGNKRYLKYSKMKEQKMSHLVSLDMSDDEFMEMIDNYIERSSYEEFIMPTSEFFKILFENSRKRVQETFPLAARIVDGELQFLLPTDREDTLQVQGNEILVGDRLITVTLLDSPSETHRGTNGTQRQGDMSSYVPAWSANGASIPKTTVPIRLDADILEWFQARGETHQEWINAALRLYVETHKQLAYS